MTTTVWVEICRKKPLFPSPPPPDGYCVSVRYAIFNETSAGRRQTVIIFLELFSFFLFYIYNYYYEICPRDNGRPAFLTLSRPAPASYLPIYRANGSPRALSSLSLKNIVKKKNNNRVGGRMSTALFSVWFFFFFF